MEEKHPPAVVLPTAKASQGLIWTIIFFLSLLWGSAFFLIKKALLYFPPIELATGRIFFATLILLPVGLSSIRKIRLRDMKYVLLFALTVNLGTAIFYALAQTRLDSALNGIVNTLVPVMTVLSGIFIYKQKAVKAELIGIGVGLLGAILLIFQSGGTLGSINAFIGFSILATICGGLSGNVLKFNLAPYKALHVSAVSLVLVLPVTAGYLGFSGFFSYAFEPENLTGLLILFFLGALSNALGLFLVARLIQLSDPVFASIITYFMPLVAMAWGIWDGERIGLMQLFGMAMILIGVLLVNRAKRRAT